MPALVTLVAAGAVFAVWIANRKRIAAETVRRAEEQARRIIQDAERDAESRKKESLLEAKEKAHDLMVDAERRSQTLRQQNIAIEQGLSKRESTVSERQAAVERHEKDLATRDRA